MEHSPLTLSALEVTVLLRVSRNTAYEMLRNGTIPSFKAGAHLKVSTKALADHLGICPEDIWAQMQTDEFKEKLAQVKKAANGKTAA